MNKEYKNKTFLVFGTGAVGGYYGGMLVKAGFNVAFIARGKNYTTLKENGLTLIRDGKKENFPVQVHDDVNNLGVFDYIFICVKSMDTKETVEKIKNNVGENTTVVSFQNGVENEEIILKSFGKEKVVGALVFVASKIVEPGVIDQFGYNGALIGELDCKKTERVFELQNILKDSGISCFIAEDINGELWNKLVWNASFNSVSVLTGKTIDEILENAELYNLIKNIMIEVREVAKSLGLNIRPDTVEFNLERSKGFTGFKTSMLQDFERGKPLEIEELVGVVIRKAKEKNVQVPYIEKLYRELLDKVNTRTTA